MMKMHQNALIFALGVLDSFGCLICIYIGSFGWTELCTCETSPWLAQSFQGALAKGAQWQGALSIFHSMRDASVTPNDFTSPGVRESQLFFEFQELSLKEGEGFCICMNRSLLDAHRLLLVFHIQDIFYISIIYNYIYIYTTLHI